MEIDETVPENYQMACENEQEFVKDQQKGRFMPRPNFGGRIEGFWNVDPSTLPHAKFIYVGKTFDTHKKAKIVKGHYRRNEVFGISVLTDDGEYSTEIWRFGNLGLTSRQSERFAKMTIGKYNIDENTRVIVLDTLYNDDPIMVFFDTIRYLLLFKYNRRSIDQIFHLVGAYAGFIGKKYKKKDEARAKRVKYGPRMPTKIYNWLIEKKKMEFIGDDFFLRQTTLTKVKAKMERQLAVGMYCCCLMEKYTIKAVNYSKRRKMMIEMGIDPESLKPKKKRNRKKKDDEEKKKPEEDLGFEMDCDYVDCSDFED